MRTLSSWPSYAMTADADSVQIHQYASGEVSVGASSALRLAIETDYPWSGSVRLRVVEAPDHEMKVALRVPAWSRSARLLIAGHEIAAGTPGQVSQRRVWRAGDTLELELEMPPRITWPDERVDAVRGCAAVERGPLVYCLETADLPAGVALEDVRINTTEPLQSIERGDLPGPALGVRASGVRSSNPAPHAWPYGDSPASAPSEAVELDLIPYFAWANRGPGGMRTWIPVASTSEERRRA